MILTTPSVRRFVPSPSAGEPEATTSTLNRSADKLCLEKGEIVSDEGSPALIACRRGKLWITQTGLARDVLLIPGQSFQPRHTGLLVIEALEASCLQRGPRQARRRKTCTEAIAL